jgi:adenylate cyclase
MGSIAHDREAARQAFEAALALSPSCALTYNLGSVVMALAGEADRAIEWGERALRLSPFDPMSYGPWLSISLGHLQRGEHQAAAEAAQKTFQANPYFSPAHCLLAATHAKLGRPAKHRRTTPCFVATIKRKQGFSKFLKFRNHVQLILFYVT